MDFYESFEDDISNDFIFTDMRTSDMMVNDNENTEFFLSHLNVFFEKNNVSKSLMSPFNFELNQKIIWENILTYNDPYLEKHSTCSNIKTSMT